MDVSPERQVELIAQWLRIFLAPGQVSELRALNVEGKKAISAFFDDPEALARRAVELDRAGAAGVYFLPNPLRPDMLTSKASARKVDIVRRHWLLVDIDAAKPAEHSGDSATETERAAAWSVLDACRGTLDGAGLVGAVIASSGNTWHLCYPIQLANDDDAQEVVKSILGGLGRLCNSDGAHVDGKTFDACRIWKLYGTHARKGASTAERPHRISYVVEGPPWNATAAEANSALLPKLLANWKYTEDLRRGRPAGDILSRAKAYIAKEPPAVSGQHGHDRTFHVACVLVKDFGLDQEQAFQAIQDWNRACQPPWTEKDLRRKLSEAAKSSGPVGRLIGAEPSTNGTSNGHATAPAAAKQPDQEPWQPPITLTTPSSPPEFPLHVFSDRLRCYVQECAWATNSPPDFAAVSALAVAAGAIGASRTLSITRTHRQPASLFIAMVGPPGTGKSAPLDLIKEPLEQAERRFFEDWRGDVTVWEKQEIQSRGPKPHLRRCLLDDTTTEAMVRILADNPRGLCMVRDELSALVTGLNQYKDGGKGNDRQVFLKIWSAATIRVDRKSNPDGVPLSVRKPTASIVGGIQPDVIEWFRGEKVGDRPPPDDGFLDRFLISFPNPLPAVGEQWRDISEQASRDWATIVEDLLKQGMRQLEDGTRIPYLTELDASGKQAWMAFTQAHADEINNEEFDNWLRGPWTKLTGYCGRLALVLNALHWATGDADVNVVTGESIKLAADLIAYFKAHVRRLYTIMGADPRVQSAARIIRWLEQHPSVKEFRRSDLYEHLRRSCRTPEDLQRPLDLLVQHRYIRDESGEQRQGPGRRPTTRYEVNPLWERTPVRLIQSIPLF